MENVSDKDSIYNDVPKQDLPNATAVLVLGIVSILGCFCWGVVGIISAIVALVLAKKDTVRYMAMPQLFTPSSYSNVKAGKVCAIIGLIFSLLYITIIIALIAIMGIAVLSNPQEIMRQWQGQ
jgi:hypothetical protein